MNEPLVLYHADMDGFAAACVVARCLAGRGEYRRVQYGDPMPLDVAGRPLFVLDFSWPLATMRQLAMEAQSLAWLDHHLTSEQDAAILRDEQYPHVAVHHDQSACGAALCLRWYAPLDSDAWPIIRYIQDRDLWQWRLPDSREINLALGLFWPLESNDPAECYERFLAQDPSALVPVGAALAASQRARVERLAKRAEPVTIDGRRALAVNATGDMSEIGHYLVETSGAEIGIVYFREGPGRWVHSLRSVGDLDVSAIAKARGGGGHRNAAGFQADSPCIEGGQS